MLSNFLTRIPKFLLYFEQQEDRILVEVKDSGMGIKDEIKHSIFTPFQKHKTRGTEEEKGTGLGLSIVKRIIEGHKGEICFESELGKGTSFFFTLPTQ
jgi:signal transduction histidine kinase